MIKHTKKVRRITYIIGFTSIGLGLITIISILTILQIRKNKGIEPPMPCTEFVEQIVTPASLMTIIEKVTATDRCEKLITIRDPLEGVNTLCLCPGKVIPSLFFQPGDTLRFSEMDGRMTITSLDGLNVINFDYPCCDQ